ncbi:hypothetical protein BD311DRAFT_340176 [Dichomitus squalens]|uniref:Uncharacterized protein n=1 Tax=Dichomitus squalens TaxID=114155 RepID=A0A4Q9N4P6_9APHY|nr:hypothetical protein BD311DRAFT_340176 [Dichomitus squalens]
MRAYPSVLTRRALLCRRENAGVAFSVVATTGKRTSSQAALDASASSSSSVARLNYFAHSGSRSLDREGDPGDDASARPVLRIPKRPRLLGSPFDLAKRVAARRSPALRKSRSRMLIDEDEEGDSGFRASDFEEGGGEGDLSSSGGPQRSGLPAGDIFSPRAGWGGMGSISFEFGEEEEGGSGFFERSVRGRGTGVGVRPTWLLSPEDE